MDTDERNRVGGRQKRIASNSRVSGKFGEFIEDSTDGKRRRRARIYGTVLEAVDTKRYKVLFDNGSCLDCYSNSLRVENETSLPPDLPPLPPPPTAATHPEAHNNLEEQQEASADDASEEHLPNFNPGDDEIEDDGVEDDGVEQDMPVGALPTTTDNPVIAPSYHHRKAEAKERIRAMIGRTVREKSKNQTITWTVIGDHIPSEPLEPCDKAGFKNIDSLRKFPRNGILGKLFLELMFIDTAHIKELVDKMNLAIKVERDTKVKYFSVEEFLICLGVFIGSCEFETQGKQCWSNSDHKDDEATEFFWISTQLCKFEKKRV